MAARAGVAHCLDELARETRQRLIVVLGASTENGPALVTTVVNRPKIVRGSDPLIAGFRPSRGLDNILHARLSGRNAADRTSVERADPTWSMGATTIRGFPRCAGRPLPFRRSQGCLVGADDRREAQEAHRAHRHPRGGRRYR